MNRIGALTRKLRKLGEVVKGESVKTAIFKIQLNHIDSKLGNVVVVGWEY